MREEVRCSAKEDHLIKGKHSENFRLKAERRFEEQNDSQDTEIAQELVEAFLAADIPLFKLETPRLKAFLEKRCTFKLPSRRTLERTHVDRAYGKAISAIQADLKDSQYWVGIDGNTDASKRPVANVLVGKLDGEQYHPPHLVNVTLYYNTTFQCLLKHGNNQTTAV